MNAAKGSKTLLPGNCDKDDFWVVIFSSPYSGVAIAYIAQCKPPFGVNDFWI
jgi:hypothetical protein